MAEAAETAQPEGTKTSQAGKGKTSKAKTKTRSMTPEHKANLARGREESRIVSDYLIAIDAHKPKRGRKVTRENMEERLRVLKEETIPQAVGAARLEAIQARIDLENRLSQTDETVSIEELQKQFVKVAKDYANRKGYTAEAFREAGVPPAVLREAGLIRARKSA